MVKTNFNKNILELMKSDNLDELNNEWIELDEKNKKNNKKLYKNKKRDFICICGTKIKYPNYFMNLNNGHIIIIGISCMKNHFSESKIINIKNIVYDKIFKSIPNQIVNIDNLINYSLENMNDVINEIKITIKNENLNIEQLEKLDLQLMNLKTDNNEFKKNIDEIRHCIQKRILNIKQKENERIEKIKLENEKIEKIKLENERREKEYIEKAYNDYIENIEKNKSIVENDYIIKSKYCLCKKPVLAVNKDDEDFCCLCSKIYKKNNYFKNCL